MSDKNRVLYLISRENVLRPGVLRSQVLDLAGQIKKEDKDTDIIVLDFPSIHSFFKYFRNYRSIKGYARNLGIRLTIIPILPIGRSIMPVWAIPFFLIQVVPLTLLFAISQHINIINARGHLSALTANFVNKFVPNIKVVFENHGPYLLEGITHGRWEKKDFDYKFWEKLEKRLFSASDYVISRSRGLLDYVESVSPNARTSIIPCSVKEKLFSISAIERRKMRGSLGIGNRFVVVYSGSLGSFHRPDHLAQAYSLIREYLPNPYFLIITHSDPEKLVSSLKMLGIRSNEFAVIQDPPNLGKVLPVGDAALHVYDDLPITPIVLAAKFAEYTASGLPVIVTKNLTSITSLVDDFGCGVVIDLDNQKDIHSKMQKLVKEHEVMGKNALKLAKDYFSVRVCAKKYLDLYDELVKED